MPARTTLTSTTLANTINASEGRIKVASTAGMVPGMRLYVTGELMTVLRLEPDPWVSVQRGVDGSEAQAHAVGDTIYVGRADQMYSGPPVGRPDAAIEVSPYIDVINGAIYFAQGDTTPSASANRWWQIQTNTRTSGPLGVMTSTLDPTSST